MLQTVVNSMVSGQESFSSPYRAFLSFFSFQLPADPTSSRTVEPLRLKQPLCFSYKLHLPREEGMVKKLFSKEMSKKAASRMVLLVLTQYLKAVPHFTH